MFILFRFPAGKFQLMQKISHVYFQNYQPVRINKQAIQKIIHKTKMNIQSSVRQPTLEHGSQHILTAIRSRRFDGTGQVSSTRSQGKRIKLFMGYVGFKIKDFRYLLYTCKVLYLMGSYGTMNWWRGFRSVTPNPFIVEYNPPHFVSLVGLRW